MERCKPHLEGVEYVCSVCGWGRGKCVEVPFNRDCAPEPVQAKRSTEKTKSGRSGVTPRERGERTLQEMAAKAGDDARPWPAILATLDRCFGGCTKMDERAGHCTLRGKACTCRTRWIEYLVFHPCNYVPQ